MSIIVNNNNQTSDDAVGTIDHSLNLSSPTTSIMNEEASNKTTTITTQCIDIHLHGEDHSLQFIHSSEQNVVYNNNNHIIHNNNPLAPTSSTEFDMTTNNNNNNPINNFDNNSTSHPGIELDNNDNDDRYSPLQQQYTTQTNKSPSTKTTPLPTLKLIVIFIIFICDVFAFSTVVSYVPFMVQDFGITENKTEYGYYAGLIASSYSAASLLSSIALGWLSDRVLGRRKVILMGTLCSCITSLLFGLSINFPMAITVRIVFGLVNGNIGTIKTYLGEITDKTNQARAFSFVGISFAIGSILGPLIGLLARPNIQYPNMMSMTPQFVQNFLNLFPYFLPNLFVATCSFIGFLIAYFKLEETNPRFTCKDQHLKSQSTITARSEDQGVNHTSNSEERANHRADVHNASPKSPSPSETSPTTTSSTATSSTLSDLIFDEKYRHDPNHRSRHELETIQLDARQVMSHEHPTTTCSPRTCSTTTLSINTQTTSKKHQHLHHASHPSLSLKLRIRKLFKSEIFQTYLPLFTSALNLMIGFASSAFDEVSPLFSLLPPENGGLGWTNFEIGIQGAVNGVGILVGQLFITPIIAKKLGSVWCFRLGNMLILPTVILFPELSWISKWKSQHTTAISPDILMWTFSIVITLLRTFSLNLIFTSLLILINNSVHTSSRGLLNGIVQSFVAFARMMGPVVSSSVFAFTASHSFFFPFDFRFVFILITLCHVVMIIGSMFLKKELNAPKEDAYPLEEEEEAVVSHDRENHDDEQQELIAYKHDHGEDLESGQELTVVYYEKRVEPLKTIEMSAILAHSPTITTMDDECSSSHDDDSTKLKP
ncbi:hypothetical protein C9374_001524 [Naegleria lovaniensis]|uniref:Major facilitator superfamily (MFS) profile domain-containing protein n=1 Tax=Naegleria lovaniensis TaxID=51637 RepID=A0AA88KRB3_NAELO|nr:uncharacterized protein C9374_001524 [Naegleria lovaniensis]KAG2387192.1 hypothetical protein C9374_001524 [Naegleria lovaniensis]